MDYEILEYETMECDSVSAYCSSDCGECPSDCDEACNDVECSLATSPCNDARCQSFPVDARSQSFSMDAADKSAIDILSSIPQSSHTQYPWTPDCLASSSISSAMEPQTFPLDYMCVEFISDQVTMGTPSVLVGEMPVHYEDCLLNSPECIAPYVDPYVLHNLPAKCPLPTHHHSPDYQQQFIASDPDMEAEAGGRCDMEILGQLEWIHHLQNQHGLHHHLHHQHVNSQAIGAALDNIWDSPEPASSPTQPEAIEIEAPEHSQTHTCKWMLPSGHTCYQQFNSERDIQDHCKKDHIDNLCKTETEDGKPGFWCRWKECPRDNPFAQKSKLDRHMQTHTGFKPVQCDICHEWFSATQSLVQHQRIHTGHNPWTCLHPGCTKVFKQQSALTMHMRTHTGEKPLVCEICLKKFSESSNLSKHRKIHQIEGKFKCKHCAKTFHRGDQLRRHVKIHFRNKEASVDTTVNTTDNNLVVSLDSLTKVEMS